MCLRSRAQALRIACALVPPQPYAQDCQDSPVQGLRGLIGLRAWGVECSLSNIPRTRRSNYVGMLECHEHRRIQPLTDTVSACTPTPSRVPIWRR